MFYEQLNRYKCPFLHGCIDPLITKHSKVEELIASDLENWLSNLYFEVIKLPRYAITQTCLFVARPCWQNNRYQNYYRHVRYYFWLLLWVIILCLGLTN